MAQVLRKLVAEFLKLPWLREALEFLAVDDIFLIMMRTSIPSMCVSLPCIFAYTCMFSESLESGTWAVQI